MNRISSMMSPKVVNAHAQRLLKADAQLRQETQDRLRDMAFVLKMAQRVKAQILAERISS